MLLRTYLHVEDVAHLIIAGFVVLILSSSSQHVLCPRLRWCSPNCTKCPGRFPAWQHHCNQPGNGWIGCKFYYKSKTNAIIRRRIQGKIQLLLYIIVFYTVQILSLVYFASEVSVSVWVLPIDGSHEFWPESSEINNTNCYTHFWWCTSHWAMHTGLITTIKNKH